MVKVQKERLNCLQMLKGCRTAAKILCFGLVRWMQRLQRMAGTKAAGVAIADSPNSQKKILPLLIAGFCVNHI